MTVINDDGQSPRRWTRYAFGWGLVGVAILGAVLLGAVWVSSTDSWIAQTDVIPFTDVHPYGANFFLDQEVEGWKQERTLEMAQAARIGWVKQQFSWESIEPQPGTFAWDYSDRIVELAEQHGMQVIARLDRVPAWARPNGPFPTCPPDDLALYGDFVYAFVRRYSGRVRYVQIWNEPNLSAEWCFQAADAVSYTRLLEVAYRRAKEADPNVVVLSAPLAINWEDVSMRGNVSDLVFLEQMYQAGAGDYFDILAANGFGLGFAPEEPPAEDVLNFRRVELQRAIMEQYGDASKPVWINEYGWNSPPEDFPPELLTWARTTEVEQADYTVRGIDWARARWPWLGVVNIWYFRQSGEIPPDWAVYYFAMVNPDFTPRPVYDALCLATEGVDLAGPGLHQETSAAVSAPGWRLVLEPTASAGATLTASEGNESLIFSFEGQGVSLLVLQGPDQGRLLIDVDGMPTANLPVDEAGRAFIDLAGAEERAWRVVRLAEGLEQGVHRLGLTPIDIVTIDGFIVSETRSSLYALGALCVMAAIAGVVLLRS